MDIDKNQYFVVSRGIELNNTSFGFLGASQSDTKPHYDRSYGGLVFCAESSDFLMVACICVGIVDGAHKTESDIPRYVNKPFMFNQQEVELMTVTNSFVKACGILTPTSQEQKNE